MLSMNKISKVVLLTTTLTLPNLVSAIPFSIDEFDGETASTTTPFTLDGTMIGGERDVNPGGGTYSSSGGLITFNSVDGIDNVQIYYDGDDNNPMLGYGLGGFDFTAGGADRFIVSVTSIISNPSISLATHDSSGNSAFTGPIAIPTPGIYEILFSSFTVTFGGGSSLGNSNALQLTMSDNTASGGPGSLTIDYLRTNGQTVTQSVPEPSAITLLGLGLAALGINGRRQWLLRKRQAEI